MKRVLTFIIVIFGVFLLPQIIGPVVDRITYPQLKKEAEKALQYFDEVSVDDTSNAWFYYSRAGEQFDDSAWHKEVYQYIDGKIEITPHILSAIRENKQALELLRDGTKCDFCKIPYNPEIWAPSSFSMSSSNLDEIVDIAYAQSLFNLENMNNEKAIADIFSIMTISEHVASNGHAIDYMMGCWFFYQSYKLLKMGLESGVFDEVQLEIISNKLKVFEEEWPKFARVLEIEAKSTLMMLSESRKEITARQFMAMMFLRYINWKHFFSFNFAILGGYRFMNELSDELEEKEDIDSLIFNFDDNLEKDIEERIRNYSLKNLMYGIGLANIVRLYERKLSILTKIRILHLCSEVQRYKLRNGHYPPSIDDFDRKISIDLNSGEYFSYTNYGDSVIVSSSGNDPTEQKDDVSLTLTNIGIKRYLKRKRDSSKKPEQ
ncbi:hypothetical protein KAU34_02245 [candidate division WOR-3 bacterium]|nr:hypothetical protein [candidate division WOR-3 bacterium]